MEHRNENPAGNVPSDAEAKALSRLSTDDEWVKAHCDLQYKARRRELGRLVSLLVGGAVISATASAVFLPHHGAILFGFILLGAGTTLLSRAIIRVIYR